VCGFFVSPSNSRSSERTIYNFLNTKHERRQPRSAEADKPQLNSSVTHHINVSLTAREVRVLAEPDFPKTILKEFQTSDMSADGTCYMSAQAPKKIPPKRKNLHQTKFDSRSKRFWKGLGGTFSSKRFPQKPPPKHHFLAFFFFPLLMLRISRARESAPPPAKTAALVSLARFSAFLRRDSRDWEKSQSMT